MSGRGMPMSVRREPVRWGRVSGQKEREKGRRGALKRGRRNISITPGNRIVWPIGAQRSRGDERLAGPIRVQTATPPLGPAGDVANSSSAHNSFAFWRISVANRGI
jgi:hypothetical protein